MSSRRACSLLLCAQLPFVAGCATADDAAPATRALSSSVADVPFKDRRMSEFSPAFAGQPYDLRCGDCSYALSIDVCVTLGKSSAVLGASIASLRPPSTHCEVINEHSRASRCSSDFEVSLRDVQVLRGSLDSKSAGKVAARFNYLVHGSEPVPDFLSPDIRYLFFLHPNHDRLRVDTVWMAEAVCPEVESN
jgi:hypothetical protein